MVNFFVRAVATGFALSLGSALFKKVQRQLGLDDNKDTDKKDKESDRVNAQEGATDPGLVS